MRDLSEVLHYTAENKRHTIPADALDYCIKLDGKHVKVSWLALCNVKELTDHFIKEVQGKFVDDVAFYLARDAMGQPVSKKEIHDTHTLLKQKVDSIHRRRMRQMERRRAKRQEKCVRKTPGKYVIEFT